MSERAQDLAHAPPRSDAVPGTSGDSLRHPLVSHIPALLLFVALSVWSFRPILSGLETALIGAPDSDVLRNAWGFWWFKAMIFERMRLPSFTVYLNYPRGMTLLVIDPLNCLLSLPLQAFFSLSTAYNLYLMATVAFSAFSAYLLAHRLTGLAGASTVAGTIYGFAPYVFSSSLSGNSEVVNVGWIPLYFLVLLRALEQGGRRPGLLTGLLLICTTLASWYYGFVAGMFGGIYAVGWLTLRAIRREPLRPSLIALLYSALLFAGFSLVMLLLFRDILPSLQRGIAQGGRDAATVLAGNAINLWDVYLPSPDRWDRPSLYHFPAWMLQSLPLLLLLGIRRSWSWAGLGLLGLLLAMSLKVQTHPPELFAPLWPVWARLTDLSQGLYRVFLLLPFSDAIRFPARFMVMFNLGLALVAACGLRTLFVRAERLALLWNGLGLLLACGVGLELHASARFDTLFEVTPVTPPAYVQTLADDPDFVAVAHLPTDLQGRFQLYFQALHGKPLLNYVDFVTSRLYYLEDQKLPISYSDTLYGMQQRGYDDYLKTFPRDVPPWPEPQQNREQLERLRQAGLKYIVVERGRFRPESLLEFEARILPMADRIEQTDTYDLYRLGGPGGD